MDSANQKGKIGNDALPAWFHWGTYIFTAAWFIVLVWVMWRKGDMGSPDWILNLSLAAISSAGVAYGLLKRGNQIKWNEREIRVINRAKKIDRMIKRDEVESMDLKLNKLSVTYKSGESDELDIYDLHLTYSDIFRFRKELLN
ncbi:MAG: hypothetical protein JJU46_02215 [Balneolaceae bacterium]|nr:hypothetical protein [Balneolaceae bacterium]MCH8549863.1 hypothetical protein [Balneolaceae bacterium]